MKYLIRFQYVPEDKNAPVESAEGMSMNFGDRYGTVILPNIGDSVRVDESVPEQRTAFLGKVISRHFDYFVDDVGELVCLVVVSVSPDEDFSEE